MVSLIFLADGKFEFDVYQIIQMDKNLRVGESGSANVIHSKLFRLLMVAPGFLTGTMLQYYDHPVVIGYIESFLKKNYKIANNGDEFLHNYKLNVKEFLSDDFSDRCSFLVLSFLFKKSVPFYIGIDATASVFQILGSIFYDKEWLVYSNVLLQEPSKKEKKDIYMHILNKIEYPESYTFRYLKKPKEIFFTEKIKKLIHVRSLIKKIIMLFIYQATLSTVRSEITDLYARELTLAEASGVAAFFFSELKRILEKVLNFLTSLTEFLFLEVQCFGYYFYLANGNEMKITFGKKTTYHLDFSKSDLFEKGTRKGRASIDT